jgi:hypothetical protein
MAAVLARGLSPSQNKSSQSRLKSGRYQPYAQAWQRSQRAVQTMKPHAATDQPAPDGHITHVREPKLGPSRCTRASFEPKTTPGSAAHLSGWTHRLRPTALRAGPYTQQPHSAHLARSTAPSHITSPLANRWPSTRVAPRRQDDFSLLLPSANSSS